MEDMIGKLKEVSKSSMLVTMSMFEYPCESVFDPFSKNCFSGAFLLTNGNGENLIEESPGRS